MNTKRFHQILSYILVAVLSVTVTASVFLCIGLTQKKEQSKLDALEELILDCFIGEADQVYIEDAAADAMVNALGDRWSYYVPADQVAALMEDRKNAYVGIGVTITVNEDNSGLKIIQIAEGGSAEEAGLQVGDVIVAVGGRPVKDRSLEEIKNEIRGEADTELEITAERNGKQFKATVTRKEIKTPVATAQMLKDKIGLVRIVNFNDNCKTETLAAIDELMEQGAKKLIFDVRFNGGGSASEMVAVLDYLLPEGPVFRTEDYTGKETVEKSDANCVELPMAVLVNGESYSAAEFFAAALQEYEKAVIVGEQTTGKGYFQYTYMLPDGSAVGLSTGKYFTPKGISLEEKGITPDVVVPVDEEMANAIYAGTIKPQDDHQIQAAIKALNAQ